MEWKEKWKVTDVMADTLRILICHGYLLRGTGSNMYVQSLARALCREGHHVLIMCQDSDPSLDFVSSYIREGPRSSGPQVVWERGTAYPGKCSVFQPDIGGVLPVYVMDTYPGFRVKEFTQLDDAELDWYVDRNRRSLTRLVEQFAPDAIQANHAVMLPHIVRPVAQRAEVPYYVTIHGSAIEYTVKKDPRYLPFGAEGLEGAAGIFVPSEHTARQVTEVFGAMVEGLSAKITFIPPGVDTELFTLAERDLSSSVDLLCDAVAGRTQGVTVGDFRGRNNTGTARLRDGFDIEEQIADTNAMHPDWLPEEDLDARLHALAAENRPFITFLGKLLETKGVQCIVPAMPLVLRDHPDARLVVIGFGELRGLLELMIDAIDQADIERLRRLCDFGNEHYTLAGPCCRSWTTSMPPARCRNTRGSRAVSTSRGRSCSQGTWPRRNTATFCPIPGPSWCHRWPRRRSASWRQRRWLPASSPSHRATPVSRPRWSRCRRYGGARRTSSCWGTASGS
jgi:glycosyltransferase involved in cell wall biosynthesis